MSKRSKMLRSRNDWKNKAIDRGVEKRYVSQELTRVKNERDRYKKEVKELKDRMKKLENKRPSVYGKEDLVFLALQLFLVARIGFRGVSRVLGILGRYLGIEKTPCPQTIINWVNRLSIARIQDTDRLAISQVPGAVSSNGFIWMIDTSIALGAEKILCVLAIAADHHRLKAGAPCLQDVHCIAVGTAVSWTGQTIADFLLKVIKVIGKPIAFLKDGGKDLAKAVKILVQQDYVVFSIDDLSHVIANLLKHEYGDHTLFATFISACGKASQKLKQTVLACLAPPKVSTKARFMNLHRVVLWANLILRHSPVGRATEGSLLAKLRKSIDQLPECKSFISRFLRDATPLLECQKILKTKGLGNETVEECKSLISAIPSSSPVRIGFMSWMEAQLEIARGFGLSETGLPITSDSIESLFGVAKTLGVGEVKDAHRIALHLPAMCSQLTEKDAQEVLRVSVSKQKQVMDNIPSLISQRRKILANPGSLEDIFAGQEYQGIELIPGAEKRLKNSNIPMLSNSYMDNNGSINLHPN